MEALKEKGSSILMKEGGYKIDMRTKKLLSKYYRRHLDLYSGHKIRLLDV